MTENAAYAILRIAPAFFPHVSEVLLMAIVSYLVEAITISWEITKYNAPKNSMVPQTLMGVFCTIVTVCMHTPGDDFEGASRNGFITNSVHYPEAYDNHKLASIVFCAMTWCCWLNSIRVIATRKPADAKTVPAAVAANDVVEVKAAK